MKKEIERIMGDRIVFACSYRIRRVAGVLCYKKDVDAPYRPLTSLALKELIVTNKKYSRAIIAARKGSVNMELNEKRYEKWVEKGLKKARSYVKEQAGNDEITDLLKRLIENAFYEGYMAAKEEKFNGKISII